MQQPATTASTRTLMKLAASAMQKGDGQQAVNLLQQVLAINPNHAEALHQIGFVLHSAGNGVQASDFYQRAIQADAMHLDSYIMLSKLLESQNRANEAIYTARFAAELMPNEAQAHCQLASMLMRFNLVHEVPPYLEGILPQFAKHTELQQYYCLALKLNDRFAEADAVYDTLIATHRVPVSFRILYELQLPRINQSNEQIDAVRASFARSIARFIEQKPRIEIGMLSSCPLFLLAYHNRDNKEILGNYTRMLRLIAPELNYVAPHCKATPVSISKPIRIGFLSANMHNHSVGNCYRSVMLHLAAQPEFAVTFFNLSSVMDDKIKQIIDAGVPIVSLPKNISTAQATVAEHALDILIYPDIGMDAPTHYLAMARLAPHQVCLGGHPETTGIDTIDYIISSRTYEPPHADDNYTERLLCVDGINYIFSRPKLPERWLTREELGLPLDRTLYICPMAIQKFHPDFDQVLVEILSRDPKATLVLFNDFQQASATKQMHERLLAKCDPARVIFMPWLTPEALFSVLKLADAVLDTLYFGGGTTAHYAFSLGVPIVTMPGHYARGRCVAAYYIAMGIDDAPVANDTAEYIALAVKLANDTAYASAMHTQILERNHLIFESAPYGPVVVKLMKDIVNQQLDGYAITAGKTP